MLFQQYSNSGNVDECQEGDIEFVIAREYPAEPLELLKEALNQMPLFMGAPVNRPCVGNIALWRNRIEGFLRFNIVPARFRTIRFITEDIAPRDIDLAEQGYNVYGVVVVAGTERKSQRIA